MARSSSEAVCNKRLSIAITSVLSTAGLSANSIAIYHHGRAVHHDGCEAAFDASNSTARIAYLTLMSADTCGELRAIRGSVLSGETFTLPSPANSKTNPPQAYSYLNCERLLIQPKGI